METVDELISGICRLIPCLLLIENPIQNAGLISLRLLWCQICRKLCGLELCIVHAFSVKTLKNDGKRELKGLPELISSFHTIVTIINIVKTQCGNASTGYYVVTAVFWQLCVKTLEFLTSDEQRSRNNASYSLFPAMYAKVLHVFHQTLPTVQDFVFEMSKHRSNDLSNPNSSAYRSDQQLLSIYFIDRNNKAARKDAIVAVADAADKQILPSAENNNSNNFALTLLRTGNLTKNRDTLSVLPPFLSFRGRFILLGIQLMIDAPRMKLDAQLRPSQW